MDSIPQTKNITSARVEFGIHPQLTLNFMAQRIAFTNKHDAAAQIRADRFNAQKRSENPAWVDLTADQLREQRILEWMDREVAELDGEIKAARLAKLEKAPKALLDQIDALTP